MFVIFDGAKWFEEFDVLGILKSLKMTCRKTFVRNWLKALQKL